MRRLVKHAIAGAGAAAFTVAAGVSMLGGSSQVTVAVPAPVTTLSVATASSPAPAPALGADRGTRTDRETREAQRVQITAAATRAADQRADTLAAQSEAVAAQQAKIRAAQVKAKAAKKKAQAAAAARAKAAEQARRRAVAARGYEAGVTDPREIARQIMKNKYGYGADQYSCFNYIIMRESMWSTTATNKSSGAYGIPQALPGSKMATAGSDWRTNPATQIIWGIEYMKKRYGSPCEAKVFKAAHGWY